MIGIGLPSRDFVDPQKELLLVANCIAQRFMNNAAIELENEFSTAKIISFIPSHPLTELTRKDLQRVVGDILDTTLVP